VRWKGYGPEHNKWVKHSDVFAKDTVDAYYHRYPNTPTGSPQLPLTRCPSGGVIGPSASYVGTPYSKAGGDVRGTPALPAFPAIFPASAWASVLASTPAIPLANSPDLLPARSRWHVLCDQARDHCRYLRTRVLGSY
jgi:hypothetical protein